MHLITTELNNTLNYESGVFKLGAWCDLYKSDKNNNAILLSYHWNNREKMAKDFEYLSKLYIRLIPSLAKELNNLHKTKFSDHAWHLMLGYWLIQFFAVTLDRWSMIQIAQEENPDKVLMVRVTDKNGFFLTPDDTDDAERQFLDHEWNHFFIAYLMRCWTNIKIVKNKFENTKFEYKRKEETNRKKGRFKRLFHTCVSYFLNFCITSNNYYVLINPGLSLIDLLRLRLKLSGNIYYALIFPDLIKSEYNEEMRNWKITTETSDTLFEQIIKELIPLSIPMVYVEGFSKLHKLIDIAKLPNKPDVIYTTNKHYHDDVFKVWSALKLDEGSRLVIGRHGGGLNKFNGGQKFESSVSDFYLIHGNGGNYFSHMRDVGLFWKSFKYGKWKPKGFALIVTVAMPRYAFDLRSMALAGQMLSYFEDQFTFYGNLPSEIQAQMRIRLYPVDYGWNQKQRWLDHFPSVQLDEGSTPIKKLVKKCRLFISTYNATTYLESLAANIPTVIYWDKHYWEWPEWADNDFSELQSVGVFHDTPESAAKHVTAIWDNVAQWWSEPKLQSVRQKFCRKYAHRHPSVITKLADVLREAAES